MSVPLRLILLLAAALVCGFVAVMGSGFSNAVEPESFSAATKVFWLLVGAFVSASLWLPAVVPNRFSVALALCRRVSAALLCVPAYLFGTVIVHNIARSFSGLGVSAFALAHGVILTAVCISGIAILLWPDLKVRVKPAP